ncbi:Peptidase family M23 [Streptomyces sp. 2224.1]|nr:Peptidase family M23 [Streptomyces sp. 2224.1]
MRRNTPPNRQRTPRPDTRRSPGPHSGSTSIRHAVSRFRRHRPGPACGRRRGTARGDWLGQARDGRHEPGRGRWHEPGRSRRHERDRGRRHEPGRGLAPSPPRSPLPPPALPPRPRFRPSTPLPPTPRAEPAGYGPSCFFPARALGALLAPAAAAVLTALSPAPASAAAAPSSVVRAERGMEHRVERGTDGPAGAAARGNRARPPESGSRAREAPEMPRDVPAGRLGAAARREAVARADPSAGDRAWPVGETGGGVGPTVVHGWEPPPSPWAAGHRGVDLAAPAGAPVRAAAPGRVAYAGTVAGRGVLTIEVSRSGRPPLRTTYEPVRPTVHKGQRVTAGQPVAVLQHGPFHCRAPCLHWGLRRGKSYLDPLSLLPDSMLRGGPSRLLPVFGIPVPAGDRTAPRHSGTVGPARSAVPAKPAAQQRKPVPTGAALMEAAGLVAAAVWALGRLHRGAGPAEAEKAMPGQPDGEWHGLRRDGG